VDIVKLVENVEAATAKPAPIRRVQLNIFWFLALVQVLWLGFIWVTGRIRLKGWAVIDRDIEPARFRFFLIGCAVSVPILIAAAIFPSIST